MVKSGGLFKYVVNTIRNMFYFESFIKLQTPLIAGRSEVSTSKSTRVVPRAKYKLQRLLQLFFTSNRNGPEIRDIRLLKTSIPRIKA